MDTLRLVRQTLPRCCVFENVGAMNHKKDASRSAADVLMTELAASNYSVVMRELDLGVFHQAARRRQGTHVSKKNVRQLQVSTPHSSHAPSRSCRKPKKRAQGAAPTSTSSLFETLTQKKKTEKHAFMRVLQQEIALQLSC